MGRKISFLIKAFEWAYNYVDWRKVNIKFGKCPLCGKKLFVRLSDDIGAIRCISCFATPVHMAMGFVLKGCVPDYNARKIYEMSSHGAFFSFLSRTVNDLTVSEYFDDVPLGEYCGKIQCQDVQQLTFPDESFHVCTCTALFEHIPNDMAGFAEIFRVIKLGGFFIFTIPIHNDEHTVERARLENGRIVHLLNPVYHDDIYIRGLNTALVFRDYGRDVVDRLLAVGFDKAEILTVDDLSFLGNRPQVVIAYKK